MYSLKTSGDSIAHEFLKLIGDPIQKVAEAEGEPEDLPEQEWDNQATLDSTVSILEAVGPIVEGREASAFDEFSDDTFSDADLEGLVQEGYDNMAPEEGGDAESEVMDEALDAINLDAHASTEDPTGQHIMHGLGKIAASLRTKGEGFAADVVEATALSIREDLVKESNRKSHINGTLKKIASDFRRSGDFFAADMVIATANKIRS
jgi:hypothetical protein